MSDDKRFGIFFPLLLAFITLTLWFGFQTIQLVKERDNLTNLRNNQTPIYNNAQKMRTQLDQIAAEVARLAQGGNANAVQLVNALRARGITIDPSKAKPAGDAPAKK